MTENLFTVQMRKATRKVHAISDALVNMKMLLALNSDSVWAEGLIIFYEIFKFLEFAMKEKLHENLGKLFIPEAMNRSVAFEKDLSFYLGTNWKENYKIRESVALYLSHLNVLYKNNPDLLMAYVYHLYMGLLSGGQILQKKRRLHKKIFGTDKNIGEAVTYFDNVKISDLKNQLKTKMNSIAQNLSEIEKKNIIDESIKVFELNNSIIKSVKGAEKVLLTNLVYLISLLVLVLSIAYYYYNH